MMKLIVLACAILGAAFAATYFGARGWVLWGIVGIVTFSAYKLKS